MLYTSASEKAKYVLSGNAEYIKPSTTKKKKESIENEAIAKQFFSIMNLASFYNYSDNVQIDGEGFRPFDIKSDSGTIDDNAIGNIDGEKKVYDPLWGGTFAKREIEYLNNYYQDLDRDFVLDNRSIQDYARKIAIASLNVNKKQEAVANGTGSMRDYKEAVAIFDDLCKSANFAECRRKPGESTGLGNLGEIIARIEQTGAIQSVKVVFPEDDIDKILNDYRHILAALGLGGSGDA